MLKKVNPICTKCGKRMKSEGKKKGYSCKRCKVRLPEEAARIVELPRKIELGTFEVPTRCRRHIAKPLVREILARLPIREI